MSEHRTIRTPSGVTIAYDRAGRGAPVLCLHGWPGRRADWRRVVPLVSAVADVVTPDLRGFGDSDAPEGGDDLYLPQAHVDDMLALLDALGWDDAIVAGHDLGATIAQAIALRTPQRVRSLVLADPPYGGIGMRRYEPGVAEMLWYQGLNRSPLIEEVFDGNRHAVAAYLRYAMREFGAPDGVTSGPDFEALVDAYAAPGALTASVRYYRARGPRRGADAAAAPHRLATRAFIVWGEDDRIMRPAWADRLPEWFANYTLTLLPGVGHFVLQQAPEAVAAAIREAVPA